MVEVFLFKDKKALLVGLFKTIGKLTSKELILYIIWDRKLNDLTRLSIILNKTS